MEAAYRPHYVLIYLLTPNVRQAFGRCNQIRPHSGARRDLITEHVALLLSEFEALLL